MRNREITTIFFGGGTPSLTAPQLIEKIIDSLHRLTKVASDVEITMEANPSSTEMSKMHDFRAAGINRLSLGIQSLRDDNLQFLGRIHSAKQAYQALDIAHKIFTNYSFDLIYGLPKQSLEEWVYDLQQALNLKPKHISLYQLTIEEGTPFANLAKRGDIIMPDENTLADFYEVTQSITRQNSLQQYEISNFALKGYESRHNMTYWRYRDYIGIGPGAHGRLYADADIFAIAEAKKNLCRWATEDIRMPERWLQRVNAVNNGLANCTPIYADEARQERLLLSMRLLNEGVNIEKKYIDERNLAELSKNKMIIWRNIDNRATTINIRPTRRGAAILDEIILLLLRN